MRPKIFINILPLFGVPPNSNIGDISDNYEGISTKFSGISLITKVMSIKLKYIEIGYLLWSQPHPHIIRLSSKIDDISGNYHRISTKFPVISI